MGAVYKKTVTKPLPANAEIVERKGVRIAGWVDGRGRRRKAPVTIGKDGRDRLVITAKTYTAKYRDGVGVVREVATGCRDEAAARSVLGDLERRAELVKGKIITSAEDAIADHQETLLSDHIGAYLVKLEAEGTSAAHRANVRRCLHRLTDDCRFTGLSDLSRQSLENWLVCRTKDGMGARTRNTYRSAAVAFCNWCLETNRLLTNPFIKVPKADEKSDCRRRRRALDENELGRLLEIARSRPLLDAMTVRRGKRKGGRYAKLSEKTRCKLERLGFERALIYKTLLLTGLRKSELASITVRQVVLNVPIPHLELRAADEKNREGSMIPLRADLAEDLRQWLADKELAFQEAAGLAPSVHSELKHLNSTKRSLHDSEALKWQNGQQMASVPTLPPGTPLFKVPAGLVRILDRDLKAAGISKQDERGMTVDVHAMRHTFGSLLSKGGVTPRTAQSAMRHSTINLTMNTYTAPRLLDVAGALESLPALPLLDESMIEKNIVSVAGTDNSSASQFAPEFAPTPVRAGALWSESDILAAPDEEKIKAGTVDVSAYPVKENSPLTTAVKGLHRVGATRLELVTSSLSTVLGRPAEEQLSPYLIASYMIWASRARRCKQMHFRA